MTKKAVDPRILRLVDALRTVGAATEAFRETARLSVLADEQLDRIIGAAEEFAFDLLNDHPPGKKALPRE